METKKLFNFVFCLISGMLLTLSPLSAQVSEAEKLYEEGIYQLEAAGNFDEAILLFNRVVKEYSSNKQVAAKALLKLGFCYERQGSQLAEEAYIQIIEKFSDQSQQVAQARERLTSLHQQSVGAGQTIKLDRGIVETNSLSPDGTKMAGTDFSQGQNVAVYDFTTKELKLVTHNNWYNVWTYYPIWSPDGKEIAYIQAGWKQSDPYSLWVSTIDGKARLIYENSNPGSKIFPREWLPNGEGVVVALQDGENCSLAIVPVSGGDPDVLQKFDNENISYASVSPDSRFVAFSEGEAGKKDIKIINIENREVTTLIDNPADDSAPRWSPGGGHIVFKSNRHGDWAIWGVAVKDARPEGAPFMIMAGARDFQLSNWPTAGLVLTRVISSADIYKMPVDLSTGKALGKPEPLRYTPTGSNYLPVWSPDGQQIAFIKQNREKREIAVVITSADGSKSQEFVLPPKCGGGFLRWTPDSKAIGFAGIDSTQKSTLFRLTPATRVWEKWPLGMAGFSRVEWSKDGNSFYYIDNGQGGSAYGIFKRTVGENEGSNIYDPEYKEGSFRDIRCSRDYSRLAFWENGAIYIMDLATGMLQRITAERDTSDLDVSDINYGSPSWSPDGKRIMVPKAIIDAKMNEKHEIHVFDLETGYSEIVDLGKSLPKDAQIREIDWSPNGKEIVIGVVSWVFEDHLMKNVIPEENR